MVRGSNLYYVMNEANPSGQPLTSKLVGSLENVVYHGQPSVYDCKCEKLSYMSNTVKLFEGIFLVTFRTDSWEFNFSRTKIFQDLPFRANW